MAETGEVSYKVKPVGKKMDDLVERIREGFLKKHGVSPKYTEVTNMIAQAIENKQILIG